MEMQHEKKKQFAQFCKCVWDHGHAEEYTNQTLSK